MEKFSITLLPGHVRLYTCSREQHQYLIKHRFYDVVADVLCQTRLENEVTFYLHVLDTNAATHAVFQSVCVTDPRLYRVIDIHEDIPGIDHVGIIYRISKRFVEKRIPILYVNTFGHNMVILLEEYLSSALDVLKEIAYL